MQPISSSLTLPTIYLGSIKSQLTLFLVIVCPYFSLSFPRSCPHRSFAALQPFCFTLGLTGLDQVVQGFFTNELSLRTWASYRSALRSYTSLCSQHTVSHPFPLSELSLARFATSYAQSSHSYGTVRVYISGLRFMQLAKGFQDPSLLAWTYLDQVLKGIRRSLPASVRSPHLPITPHILGVLFSVWSQPRQYRQHHALGSLLCGFFGFLRSGKFSCSPLAALSGSALMSTDVAVDSHTHPTVVSVHLRHSKIDIFGAGTWVHMGVLMVRSAQLKPCWDIWLFGACPLATSFSSQTNLPFPVPAW